MTYKTTTSGQVQELIVCAQSVPSQTYRVILLFVTIVPIVSIVSATDTAGRNAKFNK